jgi:hypothetical protein
VKGAARLRSFERPVLRKLPAVDGWLLVAVRTPIPVMSECRRNGSLRSFMILVAHDRGATMRCSNNATFPLPSRGRRAFSYVLTGAVTPD